MSRHGFVSMAVVRRLPRYYRYLKEINRSGVKQISSRELADCMNLTASQVRQDFNCFGNFGQQGCGYDVEALYAELSDILGFNEHYSVIIMGVGRLGSSLLDTFAFDRRGYNVLGAFDTDLTVIGKTYNGVTVQDAGLISELFQKPPKPDIGILTVPRENAAMGAEFIRRSGARAIWNFTGADLARYEASMLVENVHISDSLSTLCYRLTDHSNDY